MSLGNQFSNKWAALECPAPDPALYPCTECGWGEMTLHGGAFEGVFSDKHPLLECGTCGFTFRSCDKDMDEERLVVAYARYAVEARRAKARKQEETAA